ncbi:hypothetical protein D3C85_1781740 [compost metagenome]
MLESVERQVVEQGVIHLKALAVLAGRTFISILVMGDLVISLANSLVAGSARTDQPVAVTLRQVSS